MNLLSNTGAIVDNATEVIDSYFGFDEGVYSNLLIKDFPCEPSALQKKLKTAINQTIPRQDNADAVSIGAYTPKIYGIQSRKIASLNANFRPFAECIVAFIDQWCLNGGVKDGRTFGYSICSTKRSWYVQQNILTGNQYNENGLSWSLYGNALSIEVYYLEDDQLSELSKTVTKVKKQINFEDGSAKTFIEDAQKWFNAHPTRTGEYIRIYGVYPSIEDAIKADKAVAKNQYLSRTDTVFWAGLFSSYSNFTSWEYHPGYMPNEVWKARESFLNSCFVSDGNQDIVERIELEETITRAEADKLNDVNPLTSVVNYLGGASDPKLVKYLSTTLEIMEEDFVSLYNLKVNINTSSKYTLDQIFAWAKANPYSLTQTITLYRLSGDTVNSSLFYLVAQESDNSISFDENDVPVLAYSKLFKVDGDEDGGYNLIFTDMFGDSVSLRIDTSYKLPCDSMPSSEDFDLIDLTDVDAADDFSTSPGSPLDSAASIGREIENTAAVLSGNNGRNEFGPISSIDVDPRKALYSAESIAKSINRAKVYNEMITPPNALDYIKSSAILDVTQLGKRFVAEMNTQANEMIQPDKI